MKERYHILDMILVAILPIEAGAPEAALKNMVHTLYSTIHVYPIWMGINTDPDNIYQ